MGNLTLSDIKRLNMKCHDIFSVIEMSDFGKKFNHRHQNYSSLSYSASMSNDKTTIHFNAWDDKEIMITVKTKKKDKYEFTATCCDDFYQKIKTLEKHGYIIC